MFFPGTCTTNGFRDTTGYLDYLTIRYNYHIRRLRGLGPINAIVSSRFRCIVNYCKTRRETRRLLSVKVKFQLYLTLVSTPISVAISISQTNSQFYKWKSHPLCIGVKDLVISISAIYVLLVLCFKHLASSFYLAIVVWKL